MNKKIVIKEAWLLDEKTNERKKITLLREDDIPSLVEMEKIRGGRGSNALNKRNKWYDRLDLFNHINSKLK